MSTGLTKPLPFTVIAANQATLYPASNANLDEPGMVWRSNDLTTPYVIIDLGAAAVSYDVVAIVGSNQRSTDTVQVRTGTTNTGIGNYAGTALAAYSGTKPAGSTTLSIFKLSSTRTERYVRIDFTSTSHPDGYVSAQRIVVGKSVQADGVSANYEVEFIDKSIIDEGPGYTSVDLYPIVSQIKATVGWISDAVWRSDWFPFFMSVGTSRAILFVPDDSTPTLWQTDAVFGRIQSKASGQHPSTDSWSASLTVRELAP